MKNTLFLFFFIPITAFGQVDLKQPFEDCQVAGSITIYNYSGQEWIFSDSVDARRATLPASTFKIINSCVALETGVIKDEHVVFKWDGKERTVFGTPREAWNKDTDLESAYRNSTIWYYVALAEKVGRERYATYLDQCHYGNGDLSEAGTDFWNYGDFAVSPTNQIEFLKGFYEECLPFSADTYAIVKRIMISETTDDYTIRDKTGWTTKDGVDIGWWVGYVERKDNVCFFATRLTKPVNEVNGDFAKCRKEITKRILAQIKAID